MSLTSWALYVLLVTVIAPVLFAAQVLYVTRKDKAQKKWRQKIVRMSIAYLGASIALVIGSFLVGDDVSSKFKSVFQSFFAIMIVFAIASFIITQVQKRRLL